MMTVLYLLLALECLTLSGRTILNPDAVESELFAAEDPPDYPYLGGVHSTQAHFISVFFSKDPLMYAPRTFPETLRNVQDLLVTGGINTNVFRSPRVKAGRLDDASETEEVTWVVNTKEEAERVVEFMKGMGSKMIRAIRSGQGKDQVEVEMPWGPEEPKKETGKGSTKKSKKMKKKKSDL
jgi:hypothetical protein